MNRAMNLNFFERCYRQRSSISFRHKRKCAARRHFKIYVHRGFVHFRRELYALICVCLCMLWKYDIYDRTWATINIYRQHDGRCVLRNSFFQTIRSTTRKGSDYFCVIGLVRKKVRTLRENKFNGISRNSSQKQRVKGMVLRLINNN